MLLITVLANTIGVTCEGESGSANALLSSAQLYSRRRRRRCRPTRDQMSGMASNESVNDEFVVVAVVVVVVASAASVASSRIFYTLACF